MDIRIHIHSVLLALTAVLSSPLAGWAIGAILPPLIAIVEQPRWPKPLRAFVMLICCLAGALKAEIVQRDAGTLTPDRAIVLLIETVVAACITYQHVYKPFGLQHWEDFTSAMTTAPLQGVSRAREILADFQAFRTAQTAAMKTPTMTTVPPGQIVFAPGSQASNETAGAAPAVESEASSAAAAAGVI